LLRPLVLIRRTHRRPLVATLVDMTGLVIYFTIASIILHSTLL
jgi:hypothetical protein